MCKVWRYYRVFFLSFLFQSKAHLILCFTFRQEKMSLVSSERGLHELGLQINFCVFWYSRVTSIQSPIIYVHIFTSCPICLLKCVISTENNIIIIVAFVFLPTDERLQAMSTENCRSSSHQEMDFLHFSDFYRSNYLYRTSEVSLSLHTKQKIKKKSLYL